MQKVALLFAGKRRLFIWSVSISALLLAIWAISYSFITLDNIKVIAKRTSMLAESNPLAVFAAISAVQAVGMILALPSKGVLTVLAGALLGTALGFFATWLGVLSGTTLLFFGVRYLLRERIAGNLKGRLKQIEQGISTRPIRAMMGVRLLVALPYGPCTMAAALSSMRFRDFMIGTLIGDLPVVLLYSAAGDHLLSLASQEEVLSPTTAAVLIAIGIFFVATALLSKRSAQNSV